jgi:hypothetical protein
MRGVKEVVKFKEIFTTVDDEYKMFEGFKFKVLKETTTKDMLEDEIERRMYLIKLENGKMIEALEIEVEEGR